MTTAAGAKIITTAALFGAAAAVFTIVPFAFIIVRGILISRQDSTGGGMVVTYAILAFVTHLISSLAFIATVKILDALNTSDNTYLQNKVFPIFWNGDNKTKVISLAGGGSSIQTDAAYSTLHGIYVIVKDVYFMLPILVLSFAMAYGLYLANKNVYRQDRTTVMLYTIGSAMVAFTLYVGWAGIATPALFMPSGDLLHFIYQLWQQALLGN